MSRALVQESLIGGRIRGHLLTIHTRVGGAGTAAGACAGIGAAAVMAAVVAAVVTSVASTILGNQPCGAALLLVPDVLLEHRDVLLSLAGSLLVLPAGQNQFRQLVYVDARKRRARGVTRRVLGHRSGSQKAPGTVEPRTQHGAKKSEIGDGRGRGRPKGRLWLHSAQGTSCGPQRRTPRVGSTRTCRPKGPPRFLVRGEKSTAVALEPVTTPGGD